MTKNKLPFKILPCYYKTVLNTDADVYLLWGGRDRGASHFTAQQAILDSTKEGEYYRAVLVRKTFESIRDSQWQTIKDIVEASGIDHFFQFRKSPLEIQVADSHNKFIARGCDNPAKLKSTRDPNVAIVEEADQLTEEDFITLYTTIRHESARCRIWMAFNSDLHGVMNYEDHWIWKYYLKHMPDPYQSGLYTTTIEVPYGDDVVEQEVKFYSLHLTYRDNPYCPPSRRAVYEGLKDKNQYYYNVYAKGLLGRKENDNPWAWALSRDKHYTPQQHPVNKNYPLILSYDFNHDPCALVIAQNEQHLPRISVIAYLKASSSSESAIKQLCDRVKREYPHHANTRQLVITGDASGKARDASKPSNVNRYTEICSHFGIGTSAVKIERANTSHKASRDLVNDVLQMPQGGLVFFGGRGCEMLLSEIEMAYPDDKESLNKAKKELGLHGLDAFRYLLQMIFAHKLTGTQFKRYRQMVDGMAKRLINTPHSGVY